MTLLNQDFYLDRGQKNCDLRSTAELIADEISEKGYKNIFFVGSGGSIAMLTSFVDYFKKLSDIPVYAETSAEFIVANYKQLTGESLVLLVSKTGDAEEAVKVAQYCQDQNIPLVAFVGVKDSPVYKLAQYKIFIDEDISAFRYIQVYFLVFKLLYNKGYFNEYPKLAEEIIQLPKALINAALHFDVIAKEFAHRHHTDDYQLWIGSGPNFGELRRYTECVSEELFRIKTQAVHSAEFFHGSFEIVNEGTSVILVKGDNESRKVDERVERFLTKYCPNALIIDLKEFPLLGISEEFRKFFNPPLLSILLGDRLRKHMVEFTGLSYNTRKYYRVVNY
ncbi:SIS domain-containing protein [Ferdinandcohnia sp. Marseille-Q9671]